MVIADTWSASLMQVPRDDDGSRTGFESRCDSSRRFRTRAEALSGRVRRRSADRQDRDGAALPARLRAKAHPRPSSRSGPKRRRARRRTACSLPAASCPIRKNSSARNIRSTPTSGSRRTPPRTNIPSPPDNFRWRYFGLFYVAPNQNSYMCRLRMPNGILKAHQFAGVADLAERYGGGYAHVTTRANLQVREIEAKNAVAMIEAMQDLGPLLARLRRRQYPQRHRHADRRHRSAGTDRHAPLCARVALPHPQRPLALRPAAQVQRRLRRRRPHPGLGGHQRHRLPGRAGEGGLRTRARHLVPALPRRSHRPSRFRRRHRRAGEAGRRYEGCRRGGARLHRSPATAPTAPRRG